MNMSLFSVSDNTKIWTASASEKNIPSVPLNFPVNSPMLPNFWLSDLEFFRQFLHICVFSLLFHYLLIFFSQFFRVYSFLASSYVDISNKPLQAWRKKLFYKNGEIKTCEKFCEHECTTKEGFFWNSAWKGLH